MKKRIGMATFEVFSYRPKFSFHELEQVHGKNVVDVEKISGPADGLVSTQDHDCLCIKTADCIPLVVDATWGRALLHAGWRGLELKIIEQVSHLMPHTFYLGPHIRKCCYDVGTDFKKNFPNSQAFIKRGDKIFFDLSAQLRQQIKDQYPYAIIHDAFICTKCDTALHSYRRNQTNERNYNILKW